MYPVLNDHGMSLHAEIKCCNKVVQTHLLVPGKGEFQLRVQLKSSTCELSPHCKRISIVCFCNQMPPVYNCQQRIQVTPPVHHLLLYTGGNGRTGPSSLPVRRISTAGTFTGPGPLVRLHYRNLPRTVIYRKVYGT